jgi:hypothetical protein
MRIPYHKVILSVSALFLNVPCTSAADSPSVPPGERIPPERLELKVLKVFAAKDGEAVFRAYLVQWKGQEVIVSDSLARSSYKEGDTIPVLAMNHPFPQGAESHRLLTFTVGPTPRAR